MKKILYYFIISIMAAGCISEQKKSEKELSALISEIEKVIIPLEKEMTVSEYDANISGNEDDFNKAAELSIQMAKFFCNKEGFEKIKSFKEANKIKDELLLRQLDILYKTYLANQISEQKLEEIIRKSSELENFYLTYRVEVGGKKYSDNVVDSILKNSKNSFELKQYWEASKRIGEEAKDKILELVKLRNEVAHELGFSNYHQMALILDDQNPDDIIRIFNELDSLTANAFKELKDEVDGYLAQSLSIKKDELMPWHYQNRFFQEAPQIYNVSLDDYYANEDIISISKKYYSSIGLPVDDILNNSDLYEKEGKNQHAFCINIDRKGDVRILANVRPDLNWMNTMLHELGHGVYDKYNDLNLPFLLREPAHIFTTEAIANMFGRFSSNPQWMADNIGLSDEEKNKIAEGVQKTLQLEQLIFSRWCQVIFWFEKGMYENPDQDLNKLWWSLVEKYQLLKCPEGRDKADWASKIHLALYPAYYHNYLLGELLASQLYYYIGENIIHTTDIKNVSFTGNEKVGEYLVNNIFKPGKRYYWDDMIEKATGEKLTAKFFSQQFIY